MNPSLATDIATNVTKANRRCYPNSGQVAILSTVAMLQMQRAATQQPWQVSRAAVMAATGLSESTVRNHLKFWCERGVLIPKPLAGNPAVIVSLVE